MLSSFKSSLKRSNQSLTVQFSPGFKQTSVSPSTRVHFPKSPSLTASFQTHSPKSAIPVSPLAAADSSWSSKPIKSPAVYSFSHKDDDGDANSESETDSEREDISPAWKKDLASFVASPKTIPSNVRPKRIVSNNPNSSTDSSASDSEDDKALIPPRPQQTRTVKFAKQDSPIPRALTSQDLAHALKFLPSPLSPFPNLPYPGSPRNPELAKRTSISIDSILSSISENEEPLMDNDAGSLKPSAPVSASSVRAAKPRPKPKRRVPPALVVPKPNAPLRFVPPPGLSRCTLSPVPESPLGSALSEAYYTASDHESLAEQSDASDASDASNVTLNTAFWRSMSVDVGVEVGASSSVESLTYTLNEEVGLRLPRLEEPPYSPASQALAQVLSPNPRERTASFSSIDSALMFLGAGGAITFPINTNV